MNPQDRIGFLMSLEKVDALVVKSVDYSESSLILNVFTREMGKVRGIAKGARRLKNPFETSLDLLASIRLSFIRKNSDALDLFTEAKLRRRFRPTQRNFRGLYAGYYVAETLDFATQDYEPFPDLWTLADATGRHRRRHTQRGIAPLSAGQSAEACSTSQRSRHQARQRSVRCHRYCL